GSGPPGDHTSWRDITPAGLQFRAGIDVGRGGRGPYTREVSFRESAGCFAGANGPAGIRRDGRTVHRRGLDAFAATSPASCPRGVKVCNATGETGNVRAVSARFNGVLARASALVARRPMAGLHPVGTAGKGES